MPGCSLMMLNESPFTSTARCSTNGLACVAQTISNSHEMRNIGGVHRANIVFYVDGRAL